MKPPRFRSLDQWLGTPNLIKILSETARHEGQILFTQLVGKKTKRWQALPTVSPGVKQVLKETLERAQASLSSEGVFKFTQKQLTHQMEQTKKRLSELPEALKNSGEDWIVYYQNLPTLADKAEFVAFLILYISAYVSGSYLGYQLPNQNVKFVMKGNEDRSFTLHSAPLLSCELALEWCIAILDRTLEQPAMLNATERRRLTEAKQILLNFFQGLSRGASTKLITGRKFGGRRWNMTFRLPLEVATYEMVRTLFSSLVIEEKESK